MTFSETAEELIRYGTGFHHRGWVLGTSGNLSAVLARDPLRVAITASSVDKGALTPAQILEIDHTGRPIRGSGKPSAETLLHLQVVRTTGAAAVFHTHSVWSTVLSDFHNDESGFEISGYEMLKGLVNVSTHQHSEWIPIVENTQDMPELAAQMAEVLARWPTTHGLLVRRHGLYTWGKDLATAGRHVEVLEFLMEALCRRQMMPARGRG